VTCLLIVGAADAAEVGVGRLTVQFPPGHWEILPVADFSLAMSNDPPVPGQATLGVLRDPVLSAPLATLLVAASSGGPSRNDGSCTGSPRTYVHRMAADGFLTFGCAVVGGPYTQQVAVERVMKRLGPLAATAGAALPKNGYVLQLVVASHNGGAVLMEALLSPTLLGQHGKEAAAAVPSNIPLAYAVLADGMIAATAAAARSVFGVLRMPSFEAVVSGQ
jgi:hypothetical protein